MGEDDELLTYDEAKLRQRWVVAYYLNGKGVGGKSDKPYKSAFWTANKDQATLSILNKYVAEGYEVTIVSTCVNEPWLSA